MNIEEYRNYCLSKPLVTEEFPFDNRTLVFKVAGKMFALTDVEEFEGINLKCDPEQAIELRELYDAVKPGYHMNKLHWNTVYPDLLANDNLVKKWTDDSYNLVVQGLPKKLKDQLRVKKTA